MNFFTKLFKKKAVVEIPPMPSWETVVEMMYDKHLDTFSDEVVKVVYSKEQPVKRKNCEEKQISPENQGRIKDVPGSVAFVPSVAGLIIAGQVILDIRGEENAGN